METTAFDYVAGIVPATTDLNRVAASLPVAVTHLPSTTPASITLHSGATRGRVLMAQRDFAVGETVFNERALVWCRQRDRAALDDASAGKAHTFLRALHWESGSSLSASLLLFRQLEPECAVLPAHCSSSTCWTDSHSLNSLPDAPGGAWQRAAGWLAKVGLPIDAAEATAIINAAAIKGIMDANAFAAVRVHRVSNEEPAEMERIAAVGVLASMVNHSCTPNVAHIWRWDAGTSSPVCTFVCVRPIAMGSELCTKYIDVETQPKHVRRSTLRQRYGFTCACVRCTARWDDVMRFPCPLACDPILGYIQGWRNRCEGCGAASEEDGDVLVDERSELLTRIFAPTPVPTAQAPTGAGAGGVGSGTALSFTPRVPQTAALKSALGELAGIAEGEGADGEEGELAGMVPPTVDSLAAALTADGLSDASKATAPTLAAEPGSGISSSAAQLVDAQRLLHASDAALHLLLRKEAIAALRRGDTPSSLAHARTAYRVLPVMGMLEPTTTFASTLLYADLAAVSGDTEAAASAYAHALTLEQSLCHPMRGRVWGDDADWPSHLATQLNRALASPPTTLAQLREYQERRARVTAPAPEKGAPLVD